MQNAKWEEAILPPAWDELLDHPFQREPHKNTLAAAERETVYPPREDWFAALRLTPPEKVRAVILGQDPYHEPGQAMGLAFSVRAGVKLPPSLRNIYRELETDLGCPAPTDGDLSPWAEQGVLLLNTVLTVAAGRANSHKNLGWQQFTGELLAAVARLPQPIAFVLWGEPAKRACAQAVGGMQNAKCKMQNEATGSGQQATEKAFPPGGRRPSAKPPKGMACASEHSSPALPAGPHWGPGAERACTGADEGTLDALPGPRLILEAPHPSPLSAYRGFFGSRPFSQINAFLTAHGEAPIRWTAP